MTTPTSFPVFKLCSNTWNYPHVNNVSWFKVGRCFKLNYGMKWQFQLPGKRNKYAATHANSVFYKHSATENTVWRKTPLTFLFIHVASGIKWLLRHSVQVCSLELLIMRLWCTEITRSSRVATGHRRNGHTFCSIQLAFRRAIKSQTRENQCVSTAHWTPSRPRSVFRRADTTRPLQHMIPNTCICQYGCTAG